MYPYETHDPKRLVVFSGMRLAVLASRKIKYVKLNPSLQYFSRLLVLQTSERDYLGSLPLEEHR